MEQKDLVLICHVPLDERNGGGMRTVIDYTKHLGLRKIYSLHCERADSFNQHPFKEVIYAGFPSARFSKNWIQIFIQYRRFLKSIRRNTIYLLLPNDIDDLLLGAFAIILGKPVTVWMMDDFVSTKQPSRWAQWRICRLLGFVYRFSKKRINVSEFMDEEYRRRHEKKADLILGKRWKRKELFGPPERSPSDRLNLIWVGKFLPYYWEPIAHLKDLLEESDRKITIDIHGQARPPDEFLSPHVRYLGPFEDEDILSTIRTYDAALLTYSFDEFTIDFMKYSFPGKLIDYISAGLPVVTIAPASLKIVDQINKHDIGPVLNAMSSDDIDEIYRQLGSDTSRKREWSENGLRWAISEFQFEEGVRHLSKTLGVNPA